MILIKTGCSLSDICPAKNVQYRIPYEGNNERIKEEKFSISERNTQHIAHSACFISSKQLSLQKYALYCTMDIGNKIKERRGVLNITQEYLADLSGVGLRTIVQIENNKGNPSLTTLSKIAEILGMEVTLQIKNTGIK